MSRSGEIGIPTLVDTHAHLDEPAFDRDRNSVLDAARTAGVRRFVNIGFKPERWESSRILREQHADVEIALGVHPLEAATFNREIERALRSAVDDLAPIAVGETGLDFVRSSPSPKEQERAFRAQLELASAAGLPVIIHQRGASDALIDVLDHWQGTARIILHSFDGTPRLAGWAMERGCYIGIGGLATRSSSEQLRRLLAAMPVDRLLLETDAPYLAPPGTDRRNTPVNLVLISTMLAPLWSVSLSDFSALTTANAEAVFGDLASALPAQESLS